jgi:ABC-type dipeptide/oligopeptide/nickel transport system permease subunit
VVRAGRSDLEVEGAQSTIRSPARVAWRQFRRNRVAVAGAAFILLVVILAIIAHWVTPYHYTTLNTANARARPLTRYVVDEERLAKCHWTGTPLEKACGLFLAGSDALGRDIWSRTVYGARVSLSVAGVAVAVSLVIGAIYGAISGYSGGRTDEAMMRLVDFLYAIPGLTLIILLQTYFKALSRQGATGLPGLLIDANNALGGLLFLFIALGALSWLGIARLARGQVLSHKEREYVLAAQAVGVGRTRILFRHLLPSTIGPLLVVASLSIPGFIFAEAALSFIGLGVNPPMPSWGAMIMEGYPGLRSSPYLVLVPGLALTLLALAFNFVGDALRDAIDPRLHGT